MQEQRGDLYIISEIKEKNNELLDVYAPLIKKLINKLFEKTESLSDISVHVLNEIDFIKICYKNKIKGEFIKGSEKIISHFEVAVFDDLNNDNYDYIEHFPESVMKKLKCNILSSPNSIPLKLMKKTNWTNIKDIKSYEYERLYVHKDFKSAFIENSNLHLNYSDVIAPDHFSFVNRCKNLVIRVNGVNNLIIKDSTDMKISFSGKEKVNEKQEKVLKKYVTLINCSVIETKPKNKLKGYSHHNILSVDRRYPTNYSYRENPFYDELTNVFHVDTVKDEIRKNTKKLDELDFYPYIKSRYYKNNIGLPINSLKEYIKEKINFLTVNVVSGIAALQVDTQDLYNLKINIPCKDKELLLKAIENPNEFKDVIIKNLLTANKELYENDFKRYIEVKVSSSFSDLIQVEGKKQILEINEKFKSDLNEINYVDIVNSHLNEIEEKNVNFITPTQIKKLKEIVSALPHLAYWQVAGQTNVLIN